MTIEELLVVLLVILVCLIIDGILVILIRFLPMKRPTPIKVQRYESGLIPTIPPKYTLPMQYFGYAFMFMACEPILVLLLLFMVNPNVVTIELTLLMLILIGWLTELHSGMLIVMMPLNSILKI